VSRASRTQDERAVTMTYGVALRTLDRPGGNGVTMVFVAASDPISAEHAARRIGEARLGCTVIADHAVPCPNFEPTV
jgi:hypothetical protein